MSNIKRDFEILEKTFGYEGFFKLIKYRLRHTLFAGGWSNEITREVLERGDAAAILLYDPELDSVLLIEQFRPGAIHFSGGAWLLEIVAGIVEPGETPEDVVRRESVEEAGCQVAEIEFLYEYHVSAGGTSERISLFCGRVDASNAGGLYGLDTENEDIQVHVVKLDEALHMMRSGDIQSATAIIALQWLEANRTRVFTS